MKKDQKKAAAPSEALDNKDIAPEQELSYMMAVPSSTDELNDINGMLNRLRALPDVKITSQSFEETAIALEVEYGSATIPVLIYPDTFELPELFRVQHLFPDVDIALLQQAEAGLLVEMLFGDNPLVSYHLQLKLLHALIPDAVAVLDFSSEKILSGRWVAMAAESQVPPAPRYIYTAQAVSGDEGDVVWLHTHGLNRCGRPELEILNSNKETYNTQYTILETMANRLLEMDELLAPGEPFYLARLTQDVHLVITLIPWQDAIKRYEPDMLGGASDRESGHNGQTCVVFVYRSQEAIDNGNYEPVSIYDNILEGNPLYMFTNSETDRMKALALERFDYVRRMAEDPDITILVKLGLVPDDEYRSDDNFREHIWFELLSLSGDEMTAKLTQEPYYVSGLHTDDIGTYSLYQLTDWIIFTPEGRFSPDDAYILDLEEG